MCIVTYTEHQVSPAKAPQQIVIKKNRHSLQSVIRDLIVQTDTAQRTERQYKMTLSIKLTLMCGL